MEAHGHSPPLSRPARARMLGGRGNGRRAIRNVNFVARFPRLLITKILRELTTEELMMCAGVSTQWRVAASDNGLWKLHCFRAMWEFFRDQPSLLRAKPSSDWKSYFCFISRARKTRFTKLTGRYYSLAVSRTGQLYMWGAAPAKEDVALPTDSNVPMVMLRKGFAGERIVHASVGGLHFAAVTDSGRLYCWGRSRFGRLGLGPLDSLDAVVPAPALVVGLPDSRVISVSAGAVHTAAVTDKGEVYTWGHAGDGKLGHGELDVDCLPVPKLVVETSSVMDSTLQRSRESRIIAVECGGFHTLALAENGRVFSWGWGSHGQLGHGDMRNQSTPVLVLSLLAANSSVVAISAGLCHSAMVLADGSLYTCGMAARKQLGYRGNRDRSVPLLVESLVDVAHIVSVSCGDHHTVALAGDGAIYSWGSGYRGRLGHGRPGRSSRRRGGTEVRKSPSGRISNLEVGLEKLVRIRSTSSSSLPHSKSGIVDTGGVLVATSKRVSEVAAEESRTPGSSGSSSSGSDEDDNTTDERGPKESDRSDPSLVDPTAFMPKTVDADGEGWINFTSVSAGAWSTVAVAENGEYYSWGDSTFGQLGRGPSATGQFRPRVVKSLAVRNAVIAANAQEVYSQHF